MKNLYSAGPLWLLLFTVLLSHAQVEPSLNATSPDKPFLFSSLPEKFECNHTELEKLFSLTPSQKCQMKLIEFMPMNGVIIEKITKSEQLTSINIRLHNSANALFTLSRIAGKDGVTYTGRIVSIDHGDVLLLKKEAGKYFFVKQLQRYTMVE